MFLKNIIQQEVATCPRTKLTYYWSCTHFGGRWEGRGNSICIVKYSNQRGEGEEQLPPSSRIWNHAHVPMAARLRRGTMLASLNKLYNLGPGLKKPGCRPKMLPLCSNFLCPTTTEPLLHMVHHVSDWVAPFPCSQHYPLPPIKFLHTPPSPPTLTCTRVRGNHHHPYHGITIIESIPIVFVSLAGRRVRSRSLRYRFQSFHIWEGVGVSVYEALLNLTAFGWRHR